MNYNPEGELGLPVLTLSGRDRLRYIYDCLFYSDEYGPEDTATKRLAYHIDRAEEAPFKLVGKRAIEMYWVVGHDCLYDNPAGEIAEAVTGVTSEYLYADGYHGPRVAA